MPVTLEVDFTGLCAFVRNKKNGGVRVLMRDAGDHPKMPHDPVLVVPLADYDLENSTAKFDRIVGSKNHLGLIWMDRYDLDLSGGQGKDPLPSTAPELPPRKGSGPVPDPGKPDDDKAFHWAASLPDLVPGNQIGEASDDLFGDRPADYRMLGARLRLTGGKLETASLVKRYGVTYKWDFKWNGATKTRAIADRVLWRCVNPDWDKLVIGFRTWGDDLARTSLSLVPRGNSSAKLQFCSLPREAGYGASHMRLFFSFSKDDSSPPDIDPHDVHPSGNFPVWCAVARFADHPDA